MLFVCEDSSKNIGAVKKAAMIILSESMESPENDFVSLCKMQTFAKCYPLDNPVSKSEDLAPPELNTDASLLTQDAAIPLLECKHFPPHQTIGGYSTFDVRYLGCCDGFAGLDEDICSLNANRFLN